MGELGRTALAHHTGKDADGGKGRKARNLREGRKSVDKEDSVVERAKVDEDDGDGWA